MVHAAYQRTGPEAESVIVEGSRILAEAAAAAGARLVHVSSDLVHGGRPQPYTEADPPDPFDDYGRWKAAAEAAVLAACPEAILARPSVLFGDERPSPAQQDVIDALDGRRPMSFFTDEVRCPSHAVGVAAAIVALCAAPRSGVARPAPPRRPGGPQPVRVRRADRTLGRPLS